ncbi:hypothetical protein HAX54_022715 [Datura stramonium]|uniref:Uncharacterized protein n=1 Tax=Datura stramonium TaxID=4076 RepID=A0ABS8UV26_DATST|nr:hypothetical protein [Datura stramonium]
MSRPEQQPIGTTRTSLLIGQPCNPSQGPPHTEQISSSPLQRTSLETQSSRNREESLQPSPEAEMVKNKFEVRGGCENISCKIILSTWKHSVGGLEMPSKVFWKQGIQGRDLAACCSQKSEEIEHPMTRDEKLSSVLGERSRYIHGKGYGKKPLKKTQTQQANIEAIASYVVEIMRQDMQVDMDRELQEKHEQMIVELQSNMEQMIKK